ncbi:MAG: methylated-DNA--[protein]-cysteine S-methyltransferase [Bryobacteraceae bacterium]|nr:methylated-DNA--[protein]-cysteine S-methyltransferase [Bryobacteraceae bacterium]
MTFYTYVESPIGRLLLGGDDEGLTRLHFSSGSKAQGPDPAWVESAEPFAEVTRQLSEYFAGQRRDFTVKLRPAGTPFQLAVWEALCRIPYGETTSYGALAKDLGRPDAARAVGMANGSNPIAIIQPCHRVIGASGKLTGFGGGLPLKQALLELERGERRLF